MSKGHVMPKTTPPSFSQQAQAQYNQHLAQAANTAQQRYQASLLQNAYNPYAQATYTQSLRQILDDWQLQKEYCIAGEWMSLEEFVTYIYPEDCPERTFLILKLKGNGEEKK